MLPLYRCLFLSATVHWEPRAKPQLLTTRCWFTIGLLHSVTQFTIGEVVSVSVSSVSYGVLLPSSVYVLYCRLVSDARARVCVTVYF